MRCMAMTAAAFLSVAALNAGATGAAEAAPLAKTLFGAEQSGSAQMPAPMGSYAKGCLAGGIQMPASGPGWHFVRLSRNRNWGHPEAFAFLTRLAAAGQAAGGSTLLVGDISQPRGGPMTTGHASHQIGLDLDIWFRQGPGAAMSDAARESAGAVSMVAADKRNVTAGFGQIQRALLRAAAEDDAVARIFVNAAIKAELCRSEPAPRPWLRKLRPWWGHDAHFHVRLACPAGAELCRDQAPPPAGDGCDGSMDWWFSDEALNPPPPKAPPVRSRDVMTLADLPEQCRGVLDAD